MNVNTRHTDGLQDIAYGAIRDSSSDWLASRGAVRPAPHAPWCHGLIALDTDYRRRRHSNMTYPPLQHDAAAPPLGGEIAGALNSALVAIPQSIVIGLLAVAPLGPAHAHLGVLAGLYAAAISTAITALPRGAGCQVSGPHSALSIITASVIAGLLTRPELAGPQGVDSARVLALVFACLFMAGLFQMLLGALRFGNFVKYIPQPVVAGFMNGIAVSVFLGQIHPLLGVPASLGWFDGPEAWWQASRPLGLGVGLATLALMLWAPGPVRRLPGRLRGPLLGTLLYFFCRALWGEAAVGPTLGAMPAQFLGAEPLREALRVGADPVFWTLALELVPSALLIAVVSSVLSLMSAVSMSTLTQTRRDNRWQLVLQGLGNMLNAVFGVVPGAGAGSRSIANFRAGGRTRISALIHAGLLAFAALTLVIFPWSTYIPLVVTSALLIHTAFTAVDGWSRELLFKLRGPVRSRRELRTNLLVVALVTLVMVGFNLTSAVAAGFIATMFLFIGTISRSIVQRTYDLGERHSMRVRDQEAMAYLAEHKADARVIELEGAIFFGTADMLVTEVDTLAKDARVVLLDLRQVSDIDATGALILIQIAATLQKRGQYLLLSHLIPDDKHWHFLTDMGVNKVLPESGWFADLDHALEWTEDHLLESWPALRQSSEELSIAAVALTADLDVPGLAALSRVLERHVYAKGDTLFREGDRDDCLYVLVRGQVSVQLPVKDEKRARRLGTYGPGVIFGEMALLEGKPRSADAIADEDAITYSLSRTALDHLRHEAPEAAAGVLLSISRELANRLRITTHELRAAG